MRRDHRASRKTAPNRWIQLPCIGIGLRSPLLVLSKSVPRVPQMCGVLPMSLPPANPVCIQRSADWRRHGMAKSSYDFFASLKRASADSCLQGARLMQAFTKLLGDAAHTQQPRSGNVITKGGTDACQELAGSWQRHLPARWHSNSPWRAKPAVQRKRAAHVHQHAIAEFRGVIEPEYDILVWFVRLKCSRCVLGRRQARSLTGLNISCPGSEPSRFPRADCAFSTAMLMGSHCFPRRSREA